MVKKKKAATKKTPRTRAERRKNDRARAKAIKQTSDVAPVETLFVSTTGEVIIPPDAEIFAGPAVPFRFLPLWFGAYLEVPCYDFIGALISDVAPAARDGLKDDAKLRSIVCLRFENLELSTGLQWVQECGRIYKDLGLPLWGLTWDLRSMRKDRQGSEWWGLSIRDPKPFAATEAIFADVRAAAERLRILQAKGKLDIQAGSRVVVAS